MNGLRNNQYQAVTCSKENNFQSGVHFHATGTGKSLYHLIKQLKNFS